MPNQTLSALVGKRVYELRTAADVTQDQLARAARDCGLSSWTRSSVAGLEAANRELSALELVLLPVVLNSLGTSDKPLELLDLVPTGGIVLDRMPTDPNDPAGQVRVQALREILSGRASNVVGRVPVRDGAYFSTGLLQLRQRLWPDASAEQLDQACVDVRGEVEKLAIRILRAKPVAVTLAARREFGRSLTEERDRIAKERTPSSASDEVKQVIRGHVTRELIERLRPVVSRRSFMLTTSRNPSPALR